MIESSHTRKVNILIAIKAQKTLQSVNTVVHVSYPITWILLGYAMQLTIPTVHWTKSVLMDN